VFSGPLPCALPCHRVFVGLQVRPEGNHDQRVPAPAWASSVEETGQRFISRCRPWSGAGNRDGLGVPRSWCSLKSFSSRVSCVLFGYMGYRHRRGGRGGRCAARNLRKGLRLQARHPFCDQRGLTLKDAENSVTPDNRQRERCGPTL